MKLVNEYVPCLPSQGTNASFMAVLTTSDSPRPDYAVYVALVQLPPATSSQYKVQRECAASFTMVNGTKIPYRHAVVYFPDLKEEEYRR